MLPNCVLRSSNPSGRIAIRSFVLLAVATGVAALAPAQTGASGSPASAPPMSGIAHVAVRAKDIAGSVAFYHKLGFNQAFANVAKDGTTVTQSFIKLNDHQFIELYPVADGDAQVGFLHVCFEGANLNALHDFYVWEGLTPAPVRTAGAGNLLFTMKGPQQFADPQNQNIEYTQYMPGSKHTLDFGKHLGPDRVGEKMILVALAMQDPAAARAFYLTKLGFTPVDGSGDRLNLPGTSGEQVEIVPASELGPRASIVLESANLDKAAGQLTRQQVQFQRASASRTGADGKAHTIDMVTVSDPDGNIIRLQSTN